jgi:hypothetical protein
LRLRGPPSIRLAMGEVFGPAPTAEEAIARFLRSLGHSVAG